MKTSADSRSKLIHILFESCKERHGVCEGMSVVSRFQFEKHGGSLEQTKQKLLEVANLVDKVMPEA